MWQRWTGSKPGQHILFDPASSSQVAMFPCVVKLYHVRDKRVYFGPAAGPGLIG